MRKSGSTDKCRAGAAIPARLPFRASTCPIAWYLVPKSRPATDSSSQCLRLTDQCPIRSEAFGFARPWWSFIVDEREAGQIARPMPFETPVTAAVLPEKSYETDIFITHDGHLRVPRSTPC